MFIHLCAAHHAQEFHPAALSRDAGVTQPTVKNWATLLEACYLAVLLPPFFRNYGKRVIKSPKFYFSDPSLVCALTRQPSPDSLLMGSMGGALFEGLMVTEAWKAFLNAGIRPSMYFWRSQGGLEVDLVIHSRGKFWPVEIKLTSTPSANFTKPLDRFRDMAGKEAAEKGFVVCRVDKPTNLPGSNTALPCQAFSSWLEEVIA
jgi:predicted AAA+ superfamily ATPase